MTQSQLNQIITFCKPYYKNTGKWHAWDHIEAVKKLSLDIAKLEFPKINKHCLEAAAVIHDMGRTIRDEGHAEESGKIAKPFLASIGVPKEETQIILDAVIHHDVTKIDEAKTIEARIIFDADKIEILTNYGFLRVSYWLIEERQMELGEAINFLWEYCDRFKSKLYSAYAKNFVAKDLELLATLVQSFNSYQSLWRKAN